MTDTPYQPPPEAVAAANRGCPEPGCYGTGDPEADWVDGELVWVVACACGCSTDLFPAITNPTALTEEAS